MEMYQSTKSPIGSKSGLWINSVIEAGTGAVFLCYHLLRKMNNWINVAVLLHEPDQASAFKRSTASTII